MVGGCYFVFEVLWVFTVFDVRLCGFGCVFICLDLFCVGLGGWVGMLVFRSFTTDGCVSF